MNIINNYSTTIVSIFQDVINNYERNLEIIKQAEEELMDLEHEIELSAPKDMYKGYLAYKEVRDVRIKRRKAKEENELLKDMYDYLKSQQGQSFKNKIQSIQGASVKLRDAQEHRTYIPRQRSDLTITNHTSVAHKPFEEMLSDFNKIKVSTQNGKLRK
jgi:CHAD domain-containing protein